MRKDVVRYGLLAAVLVVATAVTLWVTRDRWSGTGSSKEDFDYAAAFESLEPGSSAPLFRIQDVAGKTEDELRAVLGPATNCESSLYSRRCTYSPGRTEVVFIDGRADWLTVNDLGETPFEDAALERIGLAEHKPSTASNSEKIWTGLAGLREVHVYGSDERIAYIRIKVKS